MRLEVRRGHEDQSVHEARSAECSDVSEWPLMGYHWLQHETTDVTASPRSDHEKQD